MAALSDRSAELIVDLHELASGHLDPLLEEESTAWQQELDWDLRPSADLVRRFMQLRSLNGFAVVNGGGVAGYSYYVVEEGKGLIGDFYVGSAFRSRYTELRLLETILDSMWRIPGLRRIEAQLMMLRHGPDASSKYARWFEAFPRLFLDLPLPAVRSLHARDPQGVAFAPWTENWRDEAARLIALSYKGHVDSRINDQYQSQAGAHRFLVNIVQYLGCGAFFSPASFVAWDRAQRTMCGLSLGSLVAPEVGHITQICVGPSHKGRGIGYELLRRSLTAFAAHGCRNVSLTVTTANNSAVRVYESMGFRRRREFSAYVWEVTR
ncbi:MAG: GNAT family N-acetyltransferase [Bryobacterales bacterium]|nr:GNAT family N-acetyltransferase [Bryobacterales bacterium]MBV9397930.1 GNAT family N-acetyltransferase [Bryobacterales bacterium]